MGRAARKDFRQVGKRRTEKTISRLDWRKAREDVEPFIHETELASLQYFNAEYFIQLADRLVQAQNVR